MLNTRMGNAIFYDSSPAGPETTKILRGNQCIPPQANMLKDICHGHFIFYMCWGLSFHILSTVYILVSISSEL